MSENVNDRNKAARIKSKIRKGKPLTEDEITFAESYWDQPFDALVVQLGGNIEAYTEGDEEVDGGHKVGRSARKHREVHVIEHDEANEGDHLPDAAYAREITMPSLLRVMGDAMARANDQHARMVELMLSRLSIVENANVGLVNAMTQHILARTEAESNQIKLANQLEAAGGDQDVAMIIDMVGKVLESKARDREEEGKRPKRKPKKSKPLGMP